MRQFSARAAWRAGFVLIEREPLAFLAWTAAYVVFGMLPQLAILAAISSQLSTLAQTTQIELSIQQMMAIQARMMVLQPLSMLGSLVGSVFLMGAVFRAVLQPDDRRFLYLRLSAAELWLGLVLLTLGVMVMLGLLALGVPIFVVTALALATGGGLPTLGLLPPFLFLAAICVAIWVALRLSMALPMSFADRTFRMAESWSLTRGHAGRMFVVFFAIANTVVIGQLVVVVLAIALVLADTFPLSIGGGVGADPLAVFSHISPIVWVVGGVLLALFGTWAATLFFAALAHMYAGLREAPDQD